eukprot:366190-Chlamydomonas_euryale.AAC.4
MPLQVAHQRRGGCGGATPCVVVWTPRHPHLLQPPWYEVECVALGVGYLVGLSVECPTGRILPSIMSDGDDDVNRPCGMLTSRDANKIVQLKQHVVYS